MEDDHAVSSTGCQRSVCPLVCPLTCASYTILPTVGIMELSKTSWSAEAFRVPFTGKIVYCARSYVPAALALSEALVSHFTLFFPFFTHRTCTQMCFSVTLTELVINNQQN
ncbi:hypothetical protein NL108_016037 [Boleophthalmus pectinirostris]|nr:hypothetical protein NL108_016037 [Boleophthalmus pectinirostris]